MVTQIELSPPMRNRPLTRKRGRGVTRLWMEGDREYLFVFVSVRVEVLGCSLTEHDAEPMTVRRESVAVLC